MKKFYNIDFGKDIGILEKEIYFKQNKDFYYLLEFTQNYVSKILDKKGNFTQKDFELLKKKIKLIKYYNEILDKKFDTDNFCILDDFFKKNFKELYTHDLIGKMSNIEFSLSNLILDELKREKNIKILLFFIEYLLVHLGEGEYLKKELKISEIESFIKEEVLYYFGNNINDGNNINVNICGKNINIIITNEIKNKEGYIDIILGDFYFLLINILKNAVKHGEANIINFIIKENHNKVILQIQDNGEGIKGFYNLNDIFNYGTTTNGSGLGLGNAKSRLDLVNGKIEVENKNGALFIITFFKK